MDQPKRKMSDLAPRRPSAGQAQKSLEPSAARPLPSPLPPRVALPKKSEPQDRAAMPVQQPRIPRSRPDQRPTPPLALDTPATEDELRLPAPRHRGLRLAIQLFIFLIVVVGLAIAIVALYAKYYQ